MAQPEAALPGLRCLTCPGLLSPWDTFCLQFPNKAHSSLNHLMGWGSTSLILEKSLKVGSTLAELTYKRSKRCGQYASIDDIFPTAIGVLNISSLREGAASHLSLGFL